MKKWLMWVCVAVMSLSLASCGGSEKEKDDDRSSQKEETQKTEKKNDIELEAPSNLVFEYNAAEALMTVTWSEVEDANDYEVDFGVGLHAYTDGEASSGLEYPMEGNTYITKVRAICKDGSDTYYSDWTVVEYTVPVCVEAPSEITFEVNGKYLEIAWPDALGATGYEIDTTYETASLSDNFAAMEVEEQEYCVISVRSVRDIESGTYYSDWITAEYLVPEIDVSNYGYRTAFLLDYDHLIEWANYNGMSYTVEQTEGFTIVDVSFEDSLNSGFWNAVSRVVGSAIGAFAGAYVSNTYDSYTNDFSSVESSLMALFESGGVKDYVYEVDDTSTTSGAVYAIAYGIEALLLNTDVHCCYYYKNTDQRAFGSYSTFLKHDREDYKEKQMGNFTPGEDGRYHLVFNPTGQDYFVEITEMKLNSYDYWAVICTHE